MKDKPKNEKIIIKNHSHCSECGCLVEDITKSVCNICAPREYGICEYCDHEYKHCICEEDAE